MKPRLPENENERLAQLHRYQVLDTPPEQAFDDLANLAAHICGTPIALVSLVDADRQWFKSSIGLSAIETSRDVSFCAHAILEPENLLIVPDATQDERFATNALVAEDPKIRFYAGAPLVTEQGLAVGTLCVIDRVARKLTEAQISALKILRNQVLRELELRLKAAELIRALAARDLAEEALREREAMLRDLLENTTDLIQRVSPHGKFLYVNRAWRETLGYTDVEVAGLQIFQVIHPANQTHCLEIFERVLRGETILRFSTSFVAKNGREIPVEGSVSCLFKGGKPLATRGIFRVLKGA